MSETYPGGCAGSPGRFAAARAATLRAADWLHHAAAPTFAIMALTTGVVGASQPDILCSAAQGASPLGGMTLMYALMCAFHLPPWLKLVGGRRNDLRRAR
ncbi:MAG: hypothetical protein P4L82_19850 [Ancalomicrobiaceae bacterium]|nr:hypothetical protein [Ancalomicrobiaceae bacterium]